MVAKAFQKNISRFDSASIVAIGNELLSGDVVDTNSSFICREMAEIGVSVISIQLVMDCHADILKALTEAASRSHFVFVTGGLGPTTDDITREAIADFCQVSLQLNPAAHERLKEKLERRGRELDDINSRQAYFPEGAAILPNHNGTADAFACRMAEGGVVVSLPGVPIECCGLMRDRILPWFRILRLESGRIFSKVFRLFGLPESEVGARIESLNLPAEIEVGYRPSFPEVRVKLVLRQNAEAEQILEKAAADVRRVLGEAVFSSSVEEGMGEVIVKLLKDKQASLAVAESCSGGLLSDAIISVPGASAVFKCGLVTYANESKETFLGVLPAVLTKEGAVSEEVARAMARGVRVRSGATYGLSITGIAGPSGGSLEKPVGLLFIGYSSAEEECGQFYQISRERNQFRWYSAYLALDFLRRKLNRDMS